MFSEVVKVAIITGLCTGIPALISSLSNRRKLSSIHSLVNSAMTEQKRIGYISALRLSSVTGDPKDIALAKEAQKIYQEALDAAEQNKTL